jgi:hypothetical protein
VGRGREWTRSGAGASLVAALVVVLTAAPHASGAVTVGQLAFESNPDTCPSRVALITPQVAAGTPFTVPTGGVITSWRTKAGSDSGGTDAKLKVFRESEFEFFLVVGQSGFQRITASSVNGPFPVRIAVEAGDYVGIRTGDDGGPCWSETAVEADISWLIQDESDAPDGAWTSFGGTLHQLRANVEAVLEPDGDRDRFGDESQDRCVGLPGPVEGCPDNNFLIGEITARKKGVVRIRVFVPGAGTITVRQVATVKRKLHRPSLRPAVVHAAARGPVTLTLKPTGTGRKNLATRKRLRILLRITFTPTGYLSRSAVIKVTSKRKGPATVTTP